MNKKIENVFNFVAAKFSNNVLSCDLESKPVPELVSLIEKLIVINAEQWVLEDEIRKPLINSECFIRIKKDIDDHYLNRISTITEIDDYFAKYEIKSTIANNRSVLFCNTETLGEIIDKLIIISLKEYFLKNKAKISLDSKRVNLLIDKFNFIKNIFQDFRKNLSKGEACVLPNIQIKIYHNKIN